MTHFNMRAVPAYFPSEAELKISETEFFDRRKGVTKIQWQAHYLPPGATRLSDFACVVVNFYHEQEPREGDVWRVRFVSRAPKAEIVFADALELMHRKVPVTALPAIEEIEVEAVEHERCQCIVRAWMVEAIERLRQRFS